MSLLSPLLTDLYQLTMGYGYWREGMASRRSVFHLFFRRLPFHGGVAVSAGIESLCEFISHFTFSDDDLAYLSSLTQGDGEPLFPQPYLRYLASLHLSVDIHALPEGTAVFPYEPLLRVEGPLLQCQLLETALLNCVGFQTLVATKSARICRAAGDAPVLEFGLRRAQGPDGAMSASRAAYLGGCAATSNVLAGKRWGIPVRGTHSHSWVLSFEGELDAFASYARSFPKGTVLLIDTFDTKRGIDYALSVARAMKERGDALLGIRIDSGDIAESSRLLRERLDGEGMASVQIIASGDIDEWKIHQIQEAGGCVDAWGVGTKLVSAYDQPALDVVYKLAGVEDAHGNWQWRAKRSASREKISFPGKLGIKRFESAGRYLYDLLRDENDPFSSEGVSKRGSLVMLDPEATPYDLLKPLYVEGRLATAPQTLDEARAHWRREQQRFSPSLLELEHSEYDVLIAPPLLQRIEEQMR